MYSVQLSLNFIAKGVLPLSSLHEPMDVHGQTKLSSNQNAHDTFLRGPGIETPQGGPGLARDARILQEPDLA